MRSGTIELRGGACDLSGRRVNEEEALGVAGSFSATAIVAGASTDCGAAAETDAVGEGSSWHACPALNDAVCAAPGES